MSWELGLMVFKLALVGSWTVLNEMLVVLGYTLRMERKELFKKNINDHYIHLHPIQVGAYAAFCSVVWILL